MNNWEDFWEYADNIDDIEEEIKSRSLEVDKIFLDVSNDPAGERMLEYLKERYLGCEIATPGDTELDIGIRQGKANLVRDIFKAIKRAKREIE